MIKGGWASIYDDGLCANGFPQVKETLPKFTIQFGLSDYEDSVKQDNDIAAWSQNPQLFPRMFTNIDSRDTNAPDKIMAEYQVDKGGYLEGREIEVILERGNLTRLSTSKNYFMDPDNNNKPNSQADIIYREWTATLKVASLGIDTSVYFYINADQGDKLTGDNTLNFLWENPGRPAIESDKYKVIVYDPQVKLVSGEWRNATNFLVDSRTPTAELPLNADGKLVGGYRKTYYNGEPAIECSFGYGYTDYVTDGNPNDYEPTLATKGIIDLNSTNTSNNQYLALKQEYDNLKLNYDNVTKTLGEVQNDKVALQSEIASLQNDKTSLQSQIESLKSDKNNLQTQINSLHENVNSLQSQSSTLKNDNDYLLSQINTNVNLQLMLGVAVIGLLLSTIYLFLKRNK